MASSTPNLADDVSAALGLAPVPPLQKPTLWLVVEEAYEYNDEYNTLTDGYSVGDAYTSKEAALAVCKEKNAELQETADPDEWYDGEIPNLYRVVPVEVVA